MKLIEFNPETLPTEKNAGQKRLPFISIGFITEGEYKPLSEL